MLQRLQVAMVMLTGESREPAFVFEVPDKFVDPGQFALEHGKNRLVAFQGLPHQFPETGQKIDAHTRMKTIRIDAADGKETNL